MKTLATLYPNFPIEVLIPLVIFVFLLAFVVAPIFLGRCFVAKKVSFLNSTSANELLSNTKSLAKIEVSGSTLSLTRASADVKGAWFEISCDGGSFFNMNKKVYVYFGKDDTVEITFKKSIDAIYMAEICDECEDKRVFFSDLYASLIIAACQFAAVAFMTALTVYAYAGFNKYTSYYFYGGVRFKNYNYAYLTVLLAPIIGVLSFFLNYKRMKLPQASEAGKGGN